MRSAWPSRRWPWPKPAVTRPRWRAACCAWPRRSCAPRRTTPRWPAPQRAAALFEAAGRRRGPGPRPLAHRLCVHPPVAQRRLAPRRAAGGGAGAAGGRRLRPGQCAERAQLQLQRHRRAAGVLQQAAAAFERAGYVYGRMLVLGNLSLTFAELGLWRHACRLGEQCMALAERMGARLNLALEMGAVLKWQLDAGRRWPACARAGRPMTRWSTRWTSRSRAHDRELWAAELSAAEGDSAGALKRLRAFLRQVRAHNPGFELYVQIPLARLLLQRGDAAAALRATRRGIALPARARLCPHRLRPEPGHLVVAQPRAGRPGPRRRSLGGAAAGPRPDAGGGAQRARRRPAPQLPEQAAGQPRAGADLAGRSRAARPARRAAPGTPAPAQQPGRPLQAPGGQRPAPEPAAQRGRAARLPDRRSHRTQRRRARAAGAGRRRAAGTSPARCCPRAKTLPPCCRP